jgi:hypothetical protein
MTIETEVKRAARSLLKRLDGTEVPTDVFVELLDKLGALPPEDEDDDEGTDIYRRNEIADAMFARVCAHLLRSGSLVEAFMQALPDLSSEQAPS